MLGIDDHGQKHEQNCLNCNKDDFEINSFVFNLEHTENCDKTWQQVILLKIWFIKLPDKSITPIWRGALPQTSIDIDFFFRSNRVGKNSVLEISKFLFYETFYILRFDQYRRIPKQFSADSTQSSFDRWQYTVYILSCMIAFNQIHETCAQVHFLAFV